ncbi:threonine--tRNA ligase [Candidatus Parcubacteria bacterium]|nr:threonine--tRNA ligase [Candidatus Parcubacteria bacterium]MBI4385510.1 threonine--tRNA ligase [Candidatus Parcubacteria bacterium]
MTKATATEKRLERTRHSLSHLLAMAVLEMFPKAKLGVGPVIENGFYYDFDLPRPLTPEDLPKLEAAMRKLISQNLAFKKREVKLAEAIAWANEHDQPYKAELMADLQKYGTTNGGEISEAVGGPKTSPTTATQKVSFYHTSSFRDLCRGPHVASTKELNPEAFKLTHIAGAYWRGSEKNPQLTRIYGVAFNDKKGLNHYLWQEAEAKKRDHRVLGERLNLFTFAPEVGPGLPLWLPKGTIMRDTIEEYAKQVEAAWGYERVTTPHIAREDLYRMSEHIPYYTESMYPPMKLDDGNYYLKAMNCPHTHMIYRSRPHSYRELPIRYAEYGTVYRYELSGTLAGLLRTRSFTQNDAHIYCREDQAEDEFLQVMKLHEFWYKKVFGLKDFYMRLSLPSQDKTKYAGMPAGWKKSVAIIRRAMKRSGLKFVEAEGEAAFYGPKVDFQIKSVIGREESASTNQLDFLAAERFKLTYRDKDGKDKPVYVVHRAPLGSHERFIAFLIEQYAGTFPVWLSPVQVSVIPVADKHAAYAKKVFGELRAAKVRAELQDQNETVGKKIRSAELTKIPYMLIVGDKEVKKKTVAVRDRERGDRGQVKLAAFIEEVSALIARHK